MSIVLTRRALVTGASLTAASLLTGCDRLGNSPAFREGLFTAENFHFWAQRTMSNRHALAREFSPQDISPVFRGNGTLNPNTDTYKALWRNGFADWRLQVDGLVNRPLSLWLDQLHSMPNREQITRHDCVEGWSAIGKWRGVPLALVLNAAGLKSNARYLVFYCADTDNGTTPYYESIDLVDAFHPQTMLAFALNDEPLKVLNGAPVRLRVERQLGYKQAKYLMRIEAVSDLSGIYGGKGGHWEDVAGYEWYAGI